MQKNNNNKKENRKVQKKVPTKTKQKIEIRRKIKWVRCYEQKIRCQIQRKIKRVIFLQICKASQRVKACSQSAAEMEIVEIPAIKSN